MTGTGENTDGNIEINTPKSWEIAQAYAQKIGAMPPSFTSIIRMLLVDQEKNNGEISNANITQAALLLNSERLRAMFYFAVKTFHAEELEKESFLNKRKLAKFFSPSELSGIIAISLLYRRCRKRCSEDDFKQMSRNIQRDLNIGGYLGQSIPHIGLTWGMLVGGCRALAETAFLLHDKDGYMRYLNTKSKKNIDFDVDFETSRWGCTSIQIASTLLQSLGFGIKYCESLVAGLDPRTPEEMIQNDNVYRVKVTRLWIDSLVNSGAIPDITHRGNYYPTEDNLQKLLSKIQVEPSPGSDLNWLDKEKEDITEETAPQLFRNGKQAAPAQPTAEVTSSSPSEDLTEGDSGEDDEDEIETVAPPTDFDVDEVLD